MDPSKTLSLIRQLVEDIQDGVGDDQISCVAMQLAEAIDDLDSWMEKGGFAPADWGHTRPLTPSERAAVRSAMIHDNCDDSLIRKVTE
jgi:hypothetical protein